MSGLINGSLGIPERCKIDLAEMGMGIRDQSVWICYDPDVPGMNNLNILENGKNILITTNGKYVISGCSNEKEGEKFKKRIMELFNIEDYVLGGND